MTTGKRPPIPTLILLLLGSFVAAHLCFWLLPAVFETWNAQSMDRIFQLRSASQRFRPAYDDTVVHVDLNNTSIQKLENFYLNRSHHARVIRNLKAMEVSVQLYDYIFAARSEKGQDRALIEAVKAAGNVHLGLAFTLLDPKAPAPAKQPGPRSPSYLARTKWRVTLQGGTSRFYRATDPLVTFSSLAQASKGLGFMTLRPDPDGVYRRLPLLVRYGDALYPSLAFRVACDYLDVPPEKIVVRQGLIILRDAKRPGEGEGRDISIPVDACGNILVNYIGPWERMRHYNFADILKADEDRDEMELWREELAGKIVVVSEVSTGSTDVGLVPTDKNFPLSGIHANVIHTILTESFVHGLSEWANLLVQVVLAALVLLLALRFSSFYFSLAGFLMGVAYVGVVAAAFLYLQVIGALIRPLLMIAFALFSIVVYRYIKEEREKLESIRERDFVRSTFGRYLSKEVVEELLGSPRGLKMSGEIREVTFLVSDLRGFTALSSRLSPHQVIDVLNRYLGRMVEIIALWRGTVNEFTGDGVLAFFGAPLSTGNDVERAVACAIEMQNAMVHINSEQIGRDLPELQMGIGINTGEVVVGNIGSEQRAKYSAVGTPINTAYRIEAQTVGGQILVSPSTYEQVGSLLQVRGTLSLQFKGLHQPLTLYDVSGIQGAHPKVLKGGGPESLTPVDPPLAILCYQLEDKAVSGEAIPGSIQCLGGFVAEIVLAQPVNMNADLKVMVAPEDATGLPPAYAKVMSVVPSPSGHYAIRSSIRFTFLPEEVKAFLKTWCVGTP